jgi:hypothetical protein
MSFAEVGGKTQQSNRNVGTIAQSRGIRTAKIQREGSLREPLCFFPVPANQETEGKDLGAPAPIKIVKFACLSRTWQYIYPE